MSPVSSKKRKGPATPRKLPKFTRAAVTMYHHQEDWFMVQKDGGPKIKLPTDAASDKSSLCGSYAVPLICPHIMKGPGTPLTPTLISS